MKTIYRARSRVAEAGLALVVGVLCSGHLQAQDAVPAWATAPRERGMVGEGLAVSPFLEGWYENPDGTYTLSFGYFNRNKESLLSLPLGPDNFIEPAEYDGLQPTQFPPGRGTGVFTVTVPGEFAENGGRVVWTLRSGGTNPHSVPGKVGIEAYRLHYGPMAMGSFPPILKLETDGPELWGPMTIGGDARLAESWESDRDPRGSTANPIQMTASVGSPLSLTVWVGDRLAPDAEREPVEGGVSWFTHQGPALAEFTEVMFTEDGPLRRATTSASFPEPGQYLLRVRGDNFNPVDSTPGDQCCWTNAYVRVTVQP